MSDAAQSDAAQSDAAQSDAAAVDTVELAGKTPDEHQPYEELGLRPDEYERIHTVLGRRPTAAELAMYSVMWSEHCSYKSSKVHLRQFAGTRTDRLLAGIGANAGVVDVGAGLAVTFKVESHNHPSFVEPYQGAATGVGGIVRDILAMGARPLAVLDPLRFGAADAPDTRRVLSGVVAGIGGYGNCLGLPNIGGEVVFDPSYAGNPLVNALCVGALPADRLQQAAATGPGNLVVLVGAKTGRDGIGGVSVLASATFDTGGGWAGSMAGGPAKRPSVQVGDPFTEKVLIECCLELFARDLVVGVQDLGGAGLTCAISETAAAGRAGMRVSLERVPLREASMEPPEVLVSESQERMLLIVAPPAVDEVLAVCRRWGALATVIGDVTDSGRLVVTWHGETVVDVPPASLADEGPVYERPIRRPADLDALAAAGPGSLPRPATGIELRETLVRMAASPNLCDRSWVTEQYDRYVRGDVVLAWPENAGVLRIDEDTERGVALSVDGNGRYCRLDPYTGTQLALAEACRNVAVTGAVPLAVTNCLNFGSPEDPEVMWQFAEACRGPRRRLPGVGPARDGRQRQLLQLHGCGGHPPDAGCRGAGPVRRRDPPDAVGLQRGGRHDPAARGDAGRVRRVGVGVGDPRPPRWPPAAGGSACRAAAGRGAGRRVPRRHGRRGPRPVRRRPRAGACGGVPAGRRRRAHRLACRGRPLRRPVQRVGGAGCGSGAAL